MRPSEQPRWGGARRDWCALTVSVLLLVVGVALFFARVGRPGRLPSRAGLEFLQAPLVISRPPVVPAGGADLREEAEVVGVTAGGRSRAYALAALAPITGHVVNDRVGEVPVVVTFCDRTNCLRVFAGPAGAADLGAAVAGWDGRPGETGLLLRVGPQVYRQDTGEPLAGGEAPFPFRGAAAERTTWGRWRRAHPDTDLYDGQPQGEPGE